MGVAIGQMLGKWVSYWFVPSIYRLFLTPFDYYAALPDILRSYSLANTHFIVLCCQLIGQLLGAIIAGGVCMALFLKVKDRK